MTPDLNEVKKELKAFTDLLGNSLYNYEDIDDCKNVIDVDFLIERHRSHLQRVFSELDG